MRGSVSEKLLIFAALLAAVALALPPMVPAHAQTVPTRCDALGESPSPSDQGFDDVGDATEPPPNVIGQPIDAAVQLLAQWNLDNWDGTAEIEEIPEVLPVDRAQAFAVDQTVVSGRPPTVHVCVGTLVPDLSGLTLAGASTRLESLGLSPGIVQKDAAEDWTVESQDPAPALLVPFGSDVVLTLLPPEVPASVSVPDIIGLPPGEAVRVVEAVSLALVVETVGEGDEGLVIEQDPLAGTRVEPGTVVVATVSLEAGGGLPGDETGDETGDDSGAETGPAGAFSPLTALGVLLALVVAVAIAVSVVVRNRLQRRWVRNHVTAAASTPGAPHMSSDGARNPPAHVARLDLNDDPGTQILEEVAL